MGQFLLKPSFAGGELTPSLYGRTDLQKYDVGAATLQNAIVLRYGGVTRRAGFKHISGTKANARARLIPFSYNAEQNYILEFTPGKVRIFTAGGIVSSGGAPVEITTPYAVSDLATIKYTQSADMLFLVQPNHPPATITRYSATDWRYEVLAIKNGPFGDAENTDVMITPSAATGTITLTANKAVFTTSHVGRLLRLGHSVSSQYFKGNPQSDVLQVTCVPNASVYVESFGFWDGSFIVWKSEPGGTWTKLREQSGNRSQNYNMTFENKDDDIRSYKVTSTAFNTGVHTGENESQRGYVTIQSFSNTYDGIAKITAVASGTVATATVIKPLGATTATSDFSFAPWGGTDGYPQAVGFFEDRLVFAGSKKYPQTYWASKTGDYNNFGMSYPQQSDDSITGTLSSGQIDGIKAIVSFGEMIMLTSGGEYRVSGGNGDPFTPTSQQARAQEYRGINDLTPVVIGGRIIYVQLHGNIVRDLAYAYDVDKYTGDDISILATHLFDGYSIVGMTYQQAPDSVVWCVRSDGVLLGMTYIKEQDMYAWHRHVTDGKFIDVCVIPGSGEDDLWAVVERNGAYSVERMTSRTEDVYVDAAYIYDGEGTKSLEGLTWLAGKAVSILADGNKLLPATVTDEGALTLNMAYKRIIVGLGYDTVIQTLPVEMAGNDGAWGSRKKRIQRLMIFFADTIGGLFGLNENRLDEIKWRSTEPYGTSIKTFTGKKFVTLPQANYDVTLMLTIKQSDPFPMTILSIIPEVLPGG